MAQSAIAMSVYLIHMADPQPDQPYSLADIVNGNMAEKIRMKRSPEFGGFKNFGKTKQKQNRIIFGN